LFHPVKVVVAMVYAGDVYDSLQHYFKMLENTGSYGKRETYSLLIYCFIYNTILNGQFEECLEDKDVLVLNKLLRCLSKDNCLIHLPVSKDRVGKPRRYYVPGDYRDTETSILRFSEDAKPRLTELND